ncbi:unnamed protein product [Didymodactylos carnosus]|uniref:Cytosolic endo-beta-N-acetylglucosaminidase n=1 Tax=Didymodactylos carnosus TaxID=1234261 RepID=A0A8S2D8M7_9BILA|nr:unnamed protein product [Didymodactylos carnosus]CAF3649251.1 unnamed protein product [Didymodactylos carnosus]
MASLNECIVCSPIKQWTDILQWSSLNLMKPICCKLFKRLNSCSKRKVLFCHDMKGGYLEDKYRQGCYSSDAYRFYFWSIIDIFCYFSHELVTIPPVVWIDCAHQNGVKVLGTFITEWDQGMLICQELLASDEIINQITTQLAEIMFFYNFDGWLLNIENKIPSGDINRLLSFVEKLKQACARKDANSIVLWYDSVTTDGDLKWQNELNALNRPFFDVCDGIFLNYTWTEDNLKRSKVEANERYLDVFVGVDVWGRGCLGNGGFNTCEAMSVVQNTELSTALFAPGWVYEHLGGENFKENETKFWNLLKPYVNEYSLQIQSFSTTFSDGSGLQFFIHGQKFSTNIWHHLGLQQYMPYINSQISISHDDAYFAGSCLLFKETGCFNLFKCVLPIESEMEVVYIRPIVKESSLSIYSHTPTQLIHSIERLELNSSTIAHTVRFNTSQSLCIHNTDERRIIYVFHRDEFEQYTFIGATYQPSFMNVSDLEICNLAYEKQFDVLKLKIEEDPNCIKKKDRDRRTILHWACSSGATDIVEFLLTKYRLPVDDADETGWTPLMIAVSTGRLDIVRMLLEKNVDVDQQNVAGARPLHYACSKNYYDARNNIAKLLLEHDADVNGTDKYQQTPLDRACSKRNFKIVELLLKDPKCDLSLHKECENENHTHIK